MGNCCRRAFKKDLTDVLDKLLKDIEHVREATVTYEYRRSQQNLWLWFGYPLIFLSTGIAWASLPAITKFWNALLVSLSLLACALVSVFYKLGLLYYTSRIASANIKLKKLQQKQDAIEKDWENLDEVRRLVRAQNTIKRIKESKILSQQELLQRQQMEAKRAQELRRRQTGDVKRLQLSKKKEEEQQQHLANLKARVNQMELFIKRQNEVIAHYQAMLKASDIQARSHVEPKQIGPQQDDDASAKSSAVVKVQDSNTETLDVNLALTKSPVFNNWFDSVIYKLVNSQSVRRICVACGKSNGLMPVEEKDTPYRCIACNHWNAPKPNLEKN